MRLGKEECKKQLSAVAGLFLTVSCSVHFPCYLQHFGAGSCHFNGICNIFELKPLLSHGICNILVLFAAFWSWKLQRYLQHF